MQILAIAPEQFNPDVHSLPTAGDLLLPGMQVIINTDGTVHPHNETVIESNSYGIVIELCRAGELAEVAVLGEQQEDGGFYFEQMWVVVT